MGRVQVSHLREPDLEDERSHLCDPGGAPAEALQVVGGQDEEALLPPGEELVPLLPQEAPQQGGGRVADGDAGAHGRADGRRRLQHVHLGGGLAQVRVRALQVAQLVEHRVGGLCGEKKLQRQLKKCKYYLF